MNIVKHYHIDNILQRSTVKHNGFFYMRVAHWVQPNGLLMEDNPGPTWLVVDNLEKNPRPVTPFGAEELERCFVARLIWQCQESGAIAPTYRTLGLGELVKAGDEWTSDNGKTWHRSVAIDCYIEPGDHYRRAVLSRSPEAAE